MLERITPHLAMIGIHKNGTWAAQKIIECVQSPEEVALIGQNLRPYAPPLLLDQFGNYVVQCVCFLLSSNNILISLAGVVFVSALREMTLYLMLWWIACGK
jgi:hypothetical protein